jgi:large subunit ribosomal protein L30
MEKEENSQNKDSSEKAPIEEDKMAIVRIRGSIGVNQDIARTLNQLMLYRKNYCVVVPKNKNYFGMVMKIKDYVTWGEIDKETHDILAERKGQEFKGRISDSKNKLKYNRFLILKGKKIKKFFRLNSPKKGYGRKGIKVPFNKGGALGNRSDKINDLIKRMI